MKLELLLILDAVKNKIKARARQRWYYQYLPDRVAEGFTLAEVLITLLIIGIVASLVIPALVADSQDAELKISYKKAFAVASQVIKQCNSEYLLESRVDQYDADANSNNFDAFMSKFSVQKQCINNNNSQCWAAGQMSNGAPGSASNHAFIDNSGMTWSARCPSSSTGCSSDMILVDTNGFKGPNIYGKDRWILLTLDNNNQRGGMPVKIATPSSGGNDFTTFDSIYCPTPPCYYKSWLAQ